MKLQKMVPKFTHNKLGKILIALVLTISILFTGNPFVSADSYEEELEFFSKDFSQLSTLEKERWVHILGSAFEDSLSARYINRDVRYFENGYFLMLDEAKIYFGDEYYEKIQEKIKPLFSSKYMLDYTTTLNKSNEFDEAIKNKLPIVYGVRSRGNIIKIEGDMQHALKRLYVSINKAKNSFHHDDLFDWGWETPPNVYGEIFFTEDEALDYINTNKAEFDSGEKVIVKNYGITKEMLQKWVSVGPIADIEKFGNSTQGFVINIEGWIEIPYIEHANEIRYIDCSKIFEFEDGTNAPFLKNPRINTYEITLSIQDNSDENLVLAHNKVDEDIYVKVNLADLGIMKKLVNQYTHIDFEDDILTRFNTKTTLRELLEIKNISSVNNSDKLKNTGISLNYLHPKQAQTVNNILSSENTKTLEYHNMFEQDSSKMQVLYPWVVFNENEKTKRVVDNIYALHKGIKSKYYDNYDFSADHISLSLVKDKPVNDIIFLQIQTIGDGDTDIAYPIYEYSEDVTDYIEPKIDGVRFIMDHYHWGYHRKDDGAKIDLTKLEFVSNGTVFDILKNGFRVDDFTNRYTDNSQDRGVSIRAIGTPNIDLDRTQIKLDFYALDEALSPNDSYYNFDAWIEVKPESFWLEKIIFPDVPVIPTPPVGPSQPIVPPVSPKPSPSIEPTEDNSVPDSPEHQLPKKMDFHPVEPKKEKDLNILHKNYYLLRGKILENIKDNIIDFLPKKYQERYLKNLKKYFLGYYYFLGYPDGSMKPEQIISRQELAEVLNRILFEDDKNTSWQYLKQFSDSIPEWSAPAISNLSKNKIYDSKYFNGKFYPHYYVTVDYFKEIRKNILKILKEK